jgi:hypothetical protein
MEQEYKHPQPPPCLCALRPRNASTVPLVTTHPEGRRWIRRAIDLHINNCTALSVKILDNVPQCTPYSDFSLYPCAINYLKVHITERQKAGNVFLFAYRAALCY